MSDYRERIVNAGAGAVVDALPRCGLFWEEARLAAIAVLKAVDMPMPPRALKFGDKVMVVRGGDLALVLDADSEDDVVLCAYADGIVEWIEIRDLDLIDA